MVPETPLAPVLCASHILTLALAFATISTAYLARLPWTRSSFSLMCNPLQAAVCVTL